MAMGQDANQNNTKGKGHKREEKKKRGSSAIWSVDLSTVKTEEAGEGAAKITSTPQ